MTQDSTIRQKKNLMRIGQLAKKAGVSAATIKHYAKEGLLPRPVKTSRNMAYYDESCVERINLIKRIQKERFLPLDVIKRLIESGESYDQEFELGRAILKPHKEPLPQKSVKGSQVARVSGYPLEKIMILEEDGLIFPTKQAIKFLTEADDELDRFLADCYLNRTQYNEAQACLDKIIEIAAPESEHADWAQMKRLKHKK